MSRVKTNFFANLAGSGWSALVGLACTPLYIRFMGMEAYGLVGFYFLLLGIVNILDLGLSPTMNREMTRYSVMPDKAGEARDSVRTLEVGYWAVGILIGAAIYFAAPHIATHWIKSGNIPESEVRRAVTIMGFLAALQWPLSLYQGGLLGLQRQVVIALFSREILLLWTGNPEVVQNAAPIVSILVIGTALNGLMNLPFAIQLADGWTRIGLVINSAFIFTLVPAILFMTINYGAAGAAFVWVALNGIYMVVGLPLIHRKILKGEMLRWFPKDVGLPLAGAVVATSIGRAFMNRPLPPFETFAALASCSRSR